MSGKKRKVGRVLLKEIAPKKWQACWLDRPTQKYIRRTLPYTNLRDAEAEANKINLELAADRGYTAGLERTGAPVRHTVKEAVLEAIKASDANDRSSREYIQLYNAFSKYLTEHMPQVRLWSDVTEWLVTEYLTHCRQLGIAHITLVNRISVLRLTSGYMARTYPDVYRHVTAALRLKRTDPPKTILALRDEILTTEQLRSLLDWLKPNAPMVYVWACMQGLCGMRMQEAGYLRRQDVDLEAKTITITESSAHKPKTRASHRVIPVCDLVIEALRDWIESMERTHPEGYLFVPKRFGGNSNRAKDKRTTAGCYGVDTLSKQSQDAVKQAKKAGIELPPKFIPRKFRATFITAMRDRHADFADLQCYVGQAPQTVMSAHYDVVSLDRLRVIADLAQGLYDDGAAKGPPETTACPSSRENVIALDAYRRKQAAQ